MEPVTLAFWNVRPDIVRDNLNRFTARTGIATRPLLLDGDYATAIEALADAGSPPDLFYAQRGEAARWMASGLIQPLDSFAETASILAEMRPLVVGSSRHPDGRIIGLTYYNAGPFALHRNEAMLARGGFAGTDDPGSYPRDWMEIEQQADVLRRRGLCDVPILMRWYPAPTGLVWAFLADACAEGERFTDADLAPLFDRDTPAALVLERWRRLVRDRLTSLASLDHDDQSIDRAWCGGGHAFYPTMDYLSGDYGRADIGPIAGYNNLNPVYPGATGDTLLLGHALICLSSTVTDPAHQSAAWALLRFLGHRDADGNLSVHRRWAMEMNLWTPFPEIDRDPDICSARLDRLYAPCRSAALAWQDRGRERALAPPLVQAPWYHAWAVRAHGIIADEVLQGTTPIAAAISRLRDLWLRLAASH